MTVGMSEPKFNFIEISHRILYRKWVRFSKADSHFSINGLLKNPESYLKIVIIGNLI
jgi:hypothetical protein